MRRAASAIFVSSVGIVSCASPVPRDAAAGMAVEMMASRQYAAMVSALAARGALDADRAMGQRMERIVGSLAEVAAGRPGAPRRWEVHAAEDAGLDAIGMPGGKLLVGAVFVRRLELSDGELATLIGHEMGHVLAAHRNPDRSTTFETSFSEDLRSDERMRLNELEADAIGIDLARKAGWPGSEILSFFGKLLAIGGEGTFSPTHPSARERLDQANALVQPGPELR